MKKLASLLVLFLALGFNACSEEENDGNSGSGNEDSNIEINISASCSSVNGEVDCTCTGSGNICLTNTYFVTCNKDELVSYEVCGDAGCDSEGCL